jgi:rfaE bifunctional protein kinase chain/domain
MTTAEILAAFPRLSALVIGDICLDRWCTYDPENAEPSRETSIPRTGVIATEVTPGAGGTVANNLTALGVGRVAVLGAIGDDGFGYELSGALALRGISAELLVRSGKMQTFTYTKLINGATGIEDQPRVDFINITPLDAEIESQIVDHVRSAVSGFDVILVSDQAETSRGGVVTAAVRAALTELAARYPEKIFFVDSRARIALYRGLTIKPNQDEAEAACRRLFDRLDYLALLEHVQAPLAIVTHGPKGALLVEKGRQVWAETQAVQNPVDICGAGDSFTAGASLALAVTRSPIDAARMGNRVASITIMKKGTGTASPAEVLALEDAGH